MRRLESGRIRRHYSDPVERLRELSTFKATIFYGLVPLLSVGVVLAEPSVSGASPVLSISISGDHFVNQNGLTVRLSGVNVPGSEYACEQGWGYGGLEGSSPAQDAETAATIAAWDADAVRVPLNEDCWLGLNGQPSFGSQSGYQQSIEDWVNALNADGIYVILDLHWSAPGTTVADGQRPMPDNHSAAFWTSVATTFKSNSAVVFDIFNEPYSPAADGFTNWPVSWSCWLNGGCTVPDSADGQTPNPSQTYTAVGMQTLVNAIRTTGSSQPIMVGGLSYANDLSGWLANEPADPDGQLAASFHNYDGESCDSLSCWNSIVAPVAAEVPVVTGEFDQGYDCLNGPPNDGFDNAYMNWADQNGVSYLAWGWWELNPGSPTPGCSTYSDDGNSTYALIDGSGNALAPDGTALQTHLAALSGSIPAPGLIGISPTSGPEAGGTAVVITGTNFTGASNVSFGSTSAATFTVNSATEITATSPVGTGTVDVTVTTSAGVTDTSAADQFTYMGSSCDPPSFTSTGSATAAAGVPFTFTVTTCSTSTPVIKASHLPAGLRLVSNDNGTANISGTPAAHDSGAYEANVTATVRGQPAATQSVVITVDNAPVFKSKTLYTAHDGVSFTYPITTQYAYPTPTITTTSTLPTGITLTDNANGTATLGGTPGPNAGGVYRITITGTNGIGVPVNQYFVLIVYQPPVIAPIDTIAITKGVAMTPLPITVTGYPEPKVRVSGLPQGITLVSGSIAGTTSVASGAYTVKITASSAAGSTTQTIILTVNS